jgi:hypothetical protein
VCGDLLASVAAGEDGLGAAASALVTASTIAAGAAAVGWEAAAGNDLSVSGFGL